MGRVLTQIKSKSMKGAKRIVDLAEWITVRREEPDSV